MNANARKLGHLEHALNQPAQPNAFDRVRLRHSALPECDLNAIDLGTPFLNRQIAAPLFVSSMTGGPQQAERINRHLAEACSEMKLAMGVGSQRIGIQDGQVAGLNYSIRQAMGNQPLLANFGAVNLQHLSAIEDLGAILEPIEADGLILHLNPMQEVFQSAGDTDWRGVLDRIQAVCHWSPVPVIVKEVGFGLDEATAKRLLEAGVHILDVAGRGGTRFDDIEISMNQNQDLLSSSSVFSGWGYSTVECLMTLSGKLPGASLWASGGIRNGHDVVKALCLGAECAGMAGALLPSAMISTEAVLKMMHTTLTEMRIACFGMGVERIRDLDQTYIWEVDNGH